jgi:hypothetical protein
MPLKKDDDKSASASLPKWMEKLYYTDERPSEQVRVLLYGEMGVGKTKFLETTGKCFVVDADRGMRTLKSIRMPAIALEAGERAYNSIMNIIQSIRKGDGPFAEDGPIGPIDTFAIDSLTSLADILMHEQMLFGSLGRRNPVDEKPQWDDYNVLKSRLKSIIEAAKNLPTNVICTANARLEKDDQSGKMVGGPDILGGFRGEVGRQFDEVYFLDTKRGKDGVQYLLYTKPVGWYKAKSRDDVPDSVISPSFEKIFGHAAEAAKETQTS